MALSRCFGIATLIMAPSLAATAQAAVVYDTTSFSASYGVAGPSAAWFGQYGTNASAVAIGKDVIITTRHQGGTTIGASVVFNGTSYKVSQQLSSFASNVDIAVYRITKPDNTPAVLSTWAKVQSGDATGLVVAIGGYGAGIGTALPGGNGYNKVNRSPNVNSGPLVVGANVIDFTSVMAAGTWSGTPLYPADFDGPTGNGSSLNPKVPLELTVGVGDSGGGWFTYSGGEWRLVGLTHAVENATTAPYGEILYGVKLTSFASTIQTLVPEPGSAMLLTSLASLSLLRRRRV